MQKLKRYINIGFRATEEEHAAILERKDGIGFPSVQAYMLKMALNGLVIHLDLSDVRECVKLLWIISVNINQIAKRVNETGSIYAEDIDDMKNQLGEAWLKMDKYIQDLAKVTELV